MRNCQCRCHRRVDSSFGGQNSSAQKGQLWSAIDTLPAFTCSVFCNRKRDKLKILHWEHNGFWLYYRRLEKGKFQWPQKDGTGVTTVSRRELRWLLDGLPLSQRQAHPKVTARTVL